MPRDNPTTSNGTAPSQTLLATTQLFVEIFGHDILYCVEEKRWLKWDGTHWVWDLDGEVERLAKKIPRIIANRARQTPDEDLKIAIRKWARRAASRHYIKAMVELAQTEPGIPVLVSTLDSNPTLFCIANGVIDLRTGTLIQSQKSLLITKQASVHFDPTADCPRWRQFIQEISGGDPELCAYLQRCTGYWLTGLTREQCFFILYGEGANGKSVFIRILQTLMGAYAMSTSPETFMEKRNPGQASPDIARLRAARLVVATESSSANVLAESLIKQMTGQDIVVCRNLYRDPFEFTPAFKLILVTNHLPHIQGTDHAIWRRIQAMPFLRTFRENEQDKHLFEKLLAELPGILNWAISGVLEYQSTGLNPPKCVEDATAAYRTDMDVLGDWLDEMCEADPSATTPVRDLYDEYCRWCHREEHAPIGKRNFGNELKKRGYLRGKMACGRLHKGIRLKGISTLHN